jgi:hypothetical protein
VFVEPKGSVHMWLPRRSFALMLVVLVAGCTARVTPPKVEVETTSPVQVEVGGKRGNGGFCPPGLRKQGRC